MNTRIITSLLLSLTIRVTLGQASGKCEDVVLNDSLFKLNTVGYDYRFERTTHSSKDSIISNVASFENGCLKFTISYSDGCGTITKRLVTDGIHHKSPEGRDYVVVNLDFNSDNFCYALATIPLYYDVAALNCEYIKIKNLRGLIKVE